MDILEIGEGLARVLRAVEWLPDAFGQGFRVKAAYTRWPEESCNLPRHGLI